jgi:excisionase family DNA binding protein
MPTPATIGAHTSTGRAVLTGPEVASLLGVGLRTLYRLRRGGEIPAIRLRGRILYTRESIDAVMARLAYGAIARD